MRNGLALETAGVKQGGLPYPEVSWHPGWNTSSAGKWWGNARPRLHLVNLGLWDGNQGAEYVFQVLINGRNYDFREEETKACGDLRLSITSAEVALHWGGWLRQNVGLVTGGGGHVLQRLVAPLRFSIKMFHRKTGSMWYSLSWVLEPCLGWVWELTISAGSKNFLHGLCVCVCVRFI